MPLTSEVVSLKSLLQKYPILVVPNYQRNFKWPEEQVANLFQDILNGLDLKNKPDDRGHFLGSIVICKDEETNSYDIVDGQQRLTVLTLILTSLAKLADEETIETAKSIVLQKDKVTSKILHKSGNKEGYSDRDSYKKIITSLGNKSKNKKNRDIEDDNSISFQKSPIYEASACLDTLAKRACEEYSKLKNDLDKIESANEIFNKISTGIKLILIETDQRKEGMRVFASINAQGTKLEPWELIMSAFYTHGPKEQQQKDVELAFEKDTYSISKVLGAPGDDSAINNGLRTFWISTRRLVSMDDLFNDFNEVLAKNSNQTEVHKNLLKQILFCAPILKGLDSAPEIQPTIKNGLFYNLECVYPLTVAMKDKLARPILLSTIIKLSDNPKAVNDALKRVSFALERARMRLIICRLTSNFVDKPFAEIAKKIYKGDFTTDPSTIEEKTYEAIREIKGFPSDEEFELAFKRFNPFGRDKKLTQVIVSRLVQAIENQDEIDSQYQFNVKKELDSLHLTKGLEFTDNHSTKEEAQSLGFESVTSLDLLTKSIGNVFISKNKDGLIDINSDFNSNLTTKDLDEKELISRRDYLAEIATRIWRF